MIVLPYEVFINSNWEYAHFFSKVQQIKYDNPSKGMNRRNMQSAISMRYDKALNINTTAFIADAWYEATTTVARYIESLGLSYLEAKELAKGFPAPDIFKIYESKGITLEVKGKRAIISMQPMGEEMERFARFLTGLKSNGYI